MGDVGKEARVRGGDEAQLTNGGSKKARVRDLRERLEKGRVRD